jgi:LuxR family maltose regulon positive regulatory protein
VRSCEEAAGRLAGERGLIRGHLEMFLNLARCMRGDTDLALRSLEDGLRRAGSAGGIYTTRLMAGIGFISQTSGDLDRVKREAGRLRALAADDGIAYTEAIGTYMEAWAHLHAFDLDRACRDFARATSRRHILHARTAVDAIAGLALTHQLLQQPDASETALDCLQDFARDDPVLLSVAESCRARLDLLRGDLSSALEWSRTGDLAPEPLELYIWLEVPAITRARVLIEAGTEESLSKAIDLLEAIRRVADPRHFTNQRIEITVLQSLALGKQGHTGEAVEALREALDLAAPGGWVRPFIEAGPAVAGMLERVREPREDAAFIRRVLAAFSSRATRPAASIAPPATTAAPSTATRSATHADLTNRELDVLELLAERLRNKEIAARLGVSTHTVNYHLKSIYSKLGVRSRRQAVAAAVHRGLVKG